MTIERRMWSRHCTGGAAARRGGATFSFVDPLFQAHDRLAYAIVLYLTAVGLWGLVLGARGTGPTSGFRGALVIAEIAAVAIGVLGVALSITRGRFEAIHALYGAALVLALPLAATLVRDRTPRGKSVALGLAALFAAGLAIRGITTAG